MTGDLVAWLREKIAQDLDRCPTLRALALAYQHRDGYREEWRPQVP